MALLSAGLLPSVKLLCLAIGPLLVFSELQGVAAPRPIDYIAWYLHRQQDFAYTPDVIADLLGEQSASRPGLAEDLGHSEVPVGMIEQELEELKLTHGQRCFATFVADHSPFWIQPQAVKIPDSLVPEIEPFLVALHLTLDDLDVRLSSSLRDRRQLGQIAPDLIEESPLEFEEIGVNAHPMVRILPVGRFEMLTLERLGRFIHEG